MSGSTSLCREKQHYLFVTGVRYHHQSLSPRFICCQLCCYIPERFRAGVGRGLGDGACEGACQSSILNIGRCGVWKDRCLSDCDTSSSCKTYRLGSSSFPVPSHTQLGDALVIPYRPGTLLVRYCHFGLFSLVLAEWSYVRYTRLGGLPEPPWYLAPGFIGGRPYAWRSISARLHKSLFNSFFP